MEPEGREQLLRPEQPLRVYRWSSWPEYLKAPGRRWPWLRVGRLLGEYRIPQDSAAGRRQMERTLEERRGGEAELAGRATGDAQKVALAKRLRAETTVTVKWIAERLHMGAPGYVNHLLYRRRKAEEQ